VTTLAGLSFNFSTRGGTPDGAEGKKKKELQGLTR